MKLYFSKGACSLVVRIIIHELGLTAEFESVDLKTKTTETGQDFYQINRKGAVPTLLTDENEILTENAAILQYLADTYHGRQLLPLLGDFERYRVIEWLNFVATDLHKNFGGIFNPKMPAAVKEEIVMPLLKSKFEFVDQKLGDNDFLMGDDFTLPDAYLYVVLRWAFFFKVIDAASAPNLQRYFDAIKKRKSIAQSLQEEGLN